MIAALHQHDSETGRRWLFFSRPPSDDVRAGLLARGWRYHRAHRGWHHADPAASVPASVTLGVGGSSSYPLSPIANTPTLSRALANIRARVAADAAARA